MVQGLSWLPCQAASAGKRPTGGSDGESAAKQDRHFTVLAKLSNCFAPPFRKHGPWADTDALPAHAALSDSTTGETAGRRSNGQLLQLDMVGAQLALAHNGYRSGIVPPLA